MYAPTCYTAVLHLSVNSTVAFTGLWTSDFGTDTASAQSFVTGHPSGSRVVIFYDPANPSGTIVLSVDYTPWKWGVTGFLACLVLLPLMFFAVLCGKRGGCVAPCGATAAPSPTAVLSSTATPVSQVPSSDAGMYEGYPVATVVPPLSGVNPGMKNVYGVTAAMYPTQYEVRNGGDPVSYPTISGYGMPAGGQQGPFVGAGGHAAAEPVRGTSV